MNFKVITNELKELFHESSQCLATLQPADQRQVQLVETLLGADMRNMANSMRIALDENATEVFLTAFTSLQYDRLSQVECFWF